MKTLARLVALLLCLAMLPACVLAESVWVIPDSDRRALTWGELMNYRYDTLLFAFNEIYARHGYKFETGSRCYNWFTLMPWYSPNASENSQNHSQTYNSMTKLENQNVDLIKQVRAYMRSTGNYNPGGIGMPDPPYQAVNKPRGFTGITLRSNQTLPVYTAPSAYSYRANNGRAAVSTNGAVYGYGWDNGWLLILYDANKAGQYRVGYVSGGSIKGDKPYYLPNVDWDEDWRYTLQRVTLTDDPAATGSALMTLPQGTTVLFLTTMYNSGAWDYIQTEYNGKAVRGFVPHGSLNETGGNEE